MTTIPTIPSPFQAEGQGEGFIPTEHPRNLKLVPPARILRHNQTDVEKTLWYYLRDRRMENLKFRRQYPLGRYIVDFICVEQQLIIELDGGQHSTQVAYDEKRDTWLKNQGYRIVRFWNNDVIENLEGVLETIRLRLAPSPSQGEGWDEGSLHATQLIHYGTAPHPGPLPRGEREKEEL